MRRYTTPLERLTVKGVDLTGPTGPPMHTNGVVQSPHDGYVP